MQESNEKTSTVVVLGFGKTDMEITERTDGTILKKVTEMEPIEVSPCTFPAHPQTEIAARQKNYEDYKRKH